jgi:crossover junction endonuclease MUS81
MATEVPKRRKRRVTVKPKKPPNPLFEKWLEEWKNEASSKGSDMQYCFGKALSSLRKYPLPLKSGRDCGILDSFGNRLCVMLDRKLNEYRKTHPAGWLNYYLTFSGLFG